MTSDHTRRRILRTASRGISSVKKIKEDLQVSESEDTIRRILNSSKKFEYQKIERKPRLTEYHVEARLAFAKKAIQERFDWSEVIWSD